VKNIEIRKASNSKRKTHHAAVQSQSEQLAGIEAKRWHVDAGTSLYESNTRDTERLKGGDHTMDVLPQDRKLAAELYECCHSCLDRARMELRNDNIDAADRWVKEYQLCKRDLDKLIKRKKEHDQLVEIAQMIVDREQLRKYIEGSRN
jgi:hypothetical protein